MTNDFAVQQALQRLLAISWKIDYTRTSSHVTLMKEYLRRSAYWIDALNLDPMEIGPFFDIAAYLVPGVRAPDSVLDRLHIPGETLVVRMCICYMHWSVIELRSEVIALGLPAPYEPLIRICERGGMFRKEHVFVKFDGAAISLENWYLKAKNRIPLPLDDASLDAIDPSTVN